MPALSFANAAIQDVIDLCFALRNLYPALPYLISVTNSSSPLTNSRKYSVRAPRPPPPLKLLSHRLWEFPSPILSLCLQLFYNLYIFLHQLWGFWLLPPPVQMLLVYRSLPRLPWLPPSLHSFIHTPINLSLYASSVTSSPYPLQFSHWLFLSPPLLMITPDPHRWPLGQRCCWCKFRPNHQLPPTHTQPWPIHMDLRHGKWYWPLSPRFRWQS